MEFEFNGVKHNIKSMMNRMEHRSIIKNMQEQFKDNLEFEDSGMTVYTKTSPKIELSKGCRACKTGTWWCIFVGSKCNLSCKFCPQDKDEKNLNAWDSNRTVVRYWIDDIKFYLDKFGDKLTGVSYSGGEPFMYVERIVEIADYIQKTQPHIYQWAYTNGVYVNEKNLNDIKSAGIKEVRVDLTATDFNDEIVNKLEMIKRIIGKVTVEVVSIPETCHKLIDEKYIHKIAELGVDQLNLAELSMMQPINWDTYAEGQDVYSYDDINGTTFSPVYSRQLTLCIIDYVIKNKINILVNDCSNDTKQLQGIMRKQNCPNCMR